MAQLNEELNTNGAAVPKFQIGGANACVRFLYVVISGEWPFKLDELRADAASYTASGRIWWCNFERGDDQIERRRNESWRRERGRDLVGRQVSRKLSRASCRASIGIATGQLIESRHQKAHKQKER